ncbi:MAG: bifunctional dihydroorotate dehydrogenase B NAD binding subunit/NADPH-dependent glutamate synthase [candidate division KSB1 bacterium]|nr:bifunctional dihydroorotate dehydrogenase B NAD binding subunit/NADPH-dependent glutamate synthase [candidate division KSB1 bacterium]MDZ7356118.1 bifunctional dihydroorotate dehydrogenase B NAD binding subunit/NADPH-dependent glutamate synthase [candidate division KSB1 bacterium]MDZ7375537.1 bifunctional dihydroorotate dehydrogenase B NAD binding subunit/NADPH-dependent glutamate synthase [candidate division KSB1 bacterium]MDZ7398905.1 bifunctional dihydroorotate dehydrogenase B NAD binding 
MKVSTYRQNEIVERRQLAPSLTLFKLYSPEIATRVKAGQFVVLRADDYAERIPLTVADHDAEQGTITVIFQVVGTSTRKLDRFQQGEAILDVVGPLGRPSHIEKFGTVVCIGGGVGIAPVYPIAKALHEAGNTVISIIGARTKEMLILEDEMRAVSDQLFVTTDDGSYGRHGFVTDELKRLIEAKTPIDEVIAIGPVIMMKAVSDVTRRYQIKTVVSLNSIMVDGTGMCGGCRATIGDEVKFVCVDGPEFDGHQVKFDELILRQGMYQREERRALWHHQCKLWEEEEALRKVKVREPMPMQDPKLRIQNFDEVALGYSREQARREAARCLQCKKPPCVAGCPVEIDIPAFIAKIKEGDFMGAIHKIKEKNNLPAVCGRVCPQEEQCEKVCVLAKKGQPIAIGRLERFAADYEFSQGDIRVPPAPPKTGKRVAVIGAGPAGLTVAGDLAKMGHDVTIFEALHKAGGVLVYGIPEFRLPKRIVQVEVDYVRKLGVEIKTNMVVGQAITVDELLNNGYDAVFIGTGAGLPYFLGIPGENLNGVYSANEFLTRNNLMKAYLFPEYDTPVRVASNVAVVGGGNVAMDAARVAKRLGADHVYLVYRRSRTEMPAREEEIVNAEEEGIEFQLLTNPVRIIGDEKGWVKGIECIRMELGEPDASGRRRPIPIKGSEFVLPVEVVIAAIGQGPNPLLTKSTTGLELTKWGNIVADPETGKTSKRGVFAGGDIVTGAATVILAMGAGKKAAVAIDKYLRDGVW